MRAFEFNPGMSRSHLVGTVLTHEVRSTDGTRLRKGRVIESGDLDVLSRVEGPVHLVELGAHDIHEDEAAQVLAGLVSGANVHRRHPVQSRVNLEATVKGLLRVNPGLVFALNELAPIGVFTMLDRVPVVPGRIVAGVKIATVGIERQTLDQATALVATASHPVVEVRPFLPRQVGVVVTDMSAGRIRERFEASVRQKMAWYGSRILGFAYVAADSSQVAGAFDRLVGEGADLVLVAGGNMMDPLDPTLMAMDQIGATVTRLGAPAHPGSMFWLGEVPALQLPVLNLASCSMYSRSTVADLVLPWVMAGERVTESDIAALGYGGLLDRTMGWRFPDYASDAVVEPDEE